MKPFVGRLLITLLLLVALTALGTLGYAAIEGATLWDSLYMAAITLTAVGYDEVIPLSQSGRLFTMGLLIGGLAWMGLWFALITSFIVELDLRQVFWKRRIMKSIEEMSEHIVICGAGRSGRQIAEELSAMGRPFVVIEQDPSQVEAFRELDPAGTVLAGNATMDRTLEEAGVERASGLISCLSHDTDNLFVCLSARHLNPDMVIVARAQDESTIPKMYRAGADHVVSPMVTGAIQMASVVLRPTVLSFLDVATQSSEISLRLEEATVGKKSRFAGGTLKSARIPQETGLLVVAVRKLNGDGGKDQEAGFLFNPSGDTTLEPGDEVIVLGRTDQVEDLRSYLS